MRFKKTRKLTLKACITPLSVTGYKLTVEATDSQGLIHILSDVNLSVLQLQQNCRNWYQIEPTVYERTP